MLMNFNLVVAVAEGLTPEQVEDKLRRALRLGMDAEPLPDISLQNLAVVREQEPRLSRHEVPVERWLRSYRRFCPGLRLLQVNERWYRAVYNGEDGEEAFAFIARCSFGKIKKGDVFAAKNYAEADRDQKRENIFEN